MLLIISGFFNFVYKSRENFYEMFVMFKVIIIDKDKDLIFKIIINWNISWNRNL